MSAYYFLPRDHVRLAVADAEDIRDGLAVGDTGVVRSCKTDTRGEQSIIYVVFPHRVQKWMRANQLEIIE